MLDHDLTDAELCSKVLERCAQLADKPIAELRLIASTSDTDSQYAADQEWRGMSRGKLIEAIVDSEYDIL